MVDRVAVIDDAFERQESTMEVLFVGDVVGEEAADWLVARLPELRERLQLDHVVVNAENCAVTGPSMVDGFGITRQVLDTLLGGGVDVITGGNHSWDGPEARTVLAHPSVARPHNVEYDIGTGVITVGSGDTALTVVNLLSPTAVTPAMRAPTPGAILPAWQRIVDSGQVSGTVLIDLHGESPVEKAAFAAAVDGQVAAVLGTHTHDPTLRTHLLAGGTGYVAEVGMTGPTGDVGIGIRTEQLAAAIRGEDLGALPPYRLSSGPIALGAVRVSTTGNAPGLATRVERVA